MKKQYDILIIGAGAVGSAIARELSRYRLRVAVLDKEADVAGGTSGRNSAVVHAGFNNKPDTLMARFCVEGNQGFEEVCRELDVPYDKTGKLLTALEDSDLEILEGLVRQGKTNGCEGLRMIDAEELHRLAPEVGGVGAMLSPNTAIFDPFLYTIALAENAVLNGVEFFLNQETVEISVEEGGYAVQTQDKTYHARVVINSAGLCSDKVAAMVGVDKYTIYPCRGEYLILDTSARKHLDYPLYPAPRKGIGGLGVHLTPTIHGNIIVGPNAEYLDSYDDYSTEKDTMDELFRQAKLLLPSLERRDIIGAYSGIRSKQTPPEQGGFADFTIAEDLPGFINLVGIESPGMTASVPIAKYVAAMVCEKLSPEENKAFNPHRKGILRFSQQSKEKQAELIREDPEYGEVVCRCQKITKKEIRQAIENPLGAKTISAIKYRAWPTTGRCQGGYCLTRIAEMLVKEYGMKPEEITQRGECSELFSGRVKE